MNKISFNQAAQVLKVHPNTLKNWQKAGRLLSAEKLTVKGKPVWYVDLEEARDVSVLSSQASTSEPINSGYEQTTQEPPYAPGGPQEAGFNQNLSVWQETLTRPLLEANSELVRSNDAKTKHIEELALELGELRAELRLLKERQAAQEARRGPEMEKDIITPEPAEPAPPEPVKRGFWARLLGG